VLTYFKIKGLATDSTHTEDVAELLKFEGTKYDSALPAPDREAANLLRRAVTLGPQAYIKREEGATPTRGRQQQGGLKTRSCSTS
jgi:hypothetical protein